MDERMAAQRLKLLPKHDIAALRARWTTEQVPQVANPRRKADWRDKTITNRHWQPSPFGLTADGRLDYRGFPFAMPQYQNLQSVDLSYVSPWHGTTFLVHAVMEDCDFTGAKMGTLDESFLRCRFDLTTFDNTGLSGVFNACSFVQAKLLRCHSNAHFIDCDFRDASFADADFSRARFVRCNFEGARFKRADLHKAIFVGCLPSDTQLAACFANHDIRFESDEGEVIEVTTPAPAEDPLLAWAERYMKPPAGEG